MACGRNPAGRFRLGDDGACRACGGAGVEPGPRAGGMDAAVELQRLGAGLQLTIARC